jgi:prevent-host-death family protein
MEEVSIRRFRLQMCRYLEMVRKGRRPVALTYHGEPFGVIQPLRDYLRSHEPREEPQEGPWEPATGLQEPEPSPGHQSPRRRGSERG